MIHPAYRNELLRQQSRRIEAAARRAQALAPGEAVAPTRSSTGVARLRAVLSPATQR